MIPPEQRPDGWNKGLFGPQHAAQWELPHATIGRDPKTGNFYPFPICDLCGKCCGHVQPGILSCEACKDRREILGDLTAEECTCYECGKKWNFSGGFDPNGDLIDTCPHCGAFFALN